MGDEVAKAHAMKRPTAATRVTDTPVRSPRDRAVRWNPLAYYTNTRGPVDHVGCDVMGRGVPLLAYMSMQLLYEWCQLPGG